MISPFCPCASVGFLTRGPANLSALEFRAVKPTGSRRHSSCSLCCKWPFHKSYSQFLSWDFIHKFEHPRAVFLLIAGMQLGIVRRSVFEHAEEDLEQPLTQASQCAGMAHAFIAFVLVISLTPSAGLAKTIRPQMNCLAHEFVARPTDADFADLARLIRHRRGSGHTLQHLLATVAVRIVAHGPQQARS